MELLLVWNRINGSVHKTKLIRPMDERSADSDVCVLQVVLIAHYLK